MGLTARWFVQTLFAAFITLIFIWLIKKAADKFEVPVVQKIVNEV